MIATLLGVLGIGNSTNWFKIAGIALAVLAVVSSIYFGYRHYNNILAENARLTANNATLTANNAQLESAIATQESTILALQEDFQEITQIQAETQQSFSRSRDRVRELENRLGRHEIGFLASQRPGLVENIINDATKDASRCFEIASGSPLTQEEKDAILPSEVNSECPDLANPNQRDR